MDHVFDERGAEDPINTILGIIGQAMAQPDPPRFDAFRQFLAELPHSVDLVESIHSLPARQIRTTVTALLMQTSPFINNFAMLWYIHNLNQSLPGNPPNYLGDPPNFMGIQSGDTTTDSPENNL